jgi:arsenate reductase
MTAHWGVADPAGVEGSDEDKRAAFKRAFDELKSRIQLFISLPIASLDVARLQGHIDSIGKTQTLAT